MNLSRRAFAQLAGAGAAAFVLPPLFGAKPAAALKSIAAAKTNGIVRLSSNENPYGPSSGALDAMRETFSLAWRYPDEAADGLVESIAKLHSVSADQVILGDGSSEILKLAAAAFTSSARKLVMAEPTFEAIGAYTRVTGAEVVKVPLDASYAHDVGKIGAVGDAGLIYICNPNNPTGSITPKAAVRSLLDGVPKSTMVLVDEAYHHYAGSSDYESVIPAVASQPNLLVARTFSKIYGMAGLRCGYCVGPADVIRKLAEQQSWDSINIMAIAAARASLADAGHVSEGRKRNRETKEMVVASLKKIGFDVVPSETNFMMIDVRRDVKPMLAAMRDHGVHVGRLFPAMPHHMRVTIGTVDQMHAFLKAFREVAA